MTMHNEDIEAIPVDEPGMWAALREEFDSAFSLFFETRVESRDEALKRRTGPQEMTYVIAYRGTSEMYDSRDHYLALGQSLLPRIELALDAQTITPLFLQQWAMMMFCKGFITSYMLDDSNSTSHLVGGAEYAALVRQRRKWIAKIMAPLLNAGIRRNEVEKMVFNKIKEILDQGTFPPKFGKKWFEELITSGEPNLKEATKLKSTFEFKHFSNKDIRKLAEEVDEDIPPY